MKNLMIFFIAIFIVSKAYSVPKEYNGINLLSDKLLTIDLKSKKYIVAYFLSSSCPCSQVHFDHLNKLQKKFKNFSFIGFHSSKSITKKAAIKYFSKFKINFPILLDRDLRYANIFKAVKTPHVFVLDMKGDLLYQGGATDSRNPKRAKHFYLKDALTQISSGENIKVKNSKTLGCYIQR